MEDTTKFITGERRLCYFAEPLPNTRHEEELPLAAETLQASGEIMDVRKNAQLRRTLEAYAQDEVWQGYENFQNPVDLSYFNALIIEHTINSKDPINKEYKLDYSKFELFYPSAVDPAEWAQRYQTERFGKFKGPSWLDTGLTAAQYSTLLNGAKADLTAGKASQLRKVEYLPLLRAAVDYYAFSRGTLDQILSDAGVGIPDTRVTDEPGRLRKSLTREEYLTLLSLVWDGKADDLRSQIKSDPKGAYSALQKYFYFDGLTKDQKDKADRLHSIYGDLSVKTLGPNEALAHWGIAIGPALRHDYMDYRRGIKDSLSVPGATLKGGDSAQYWQSRPEQGLAFLSTSLPPTPGNVKFLNALRWYVENDSATPDVLPPEVSGMQRDDVFAVLRLIADTLGESEALLRNSLGKRERMKDSMSDIPKTVTEYAKSSLNYILDIQSHPINSLALGAIMFFGAKSLFRSIFYYGHKDTSPFDRFLLKGLGAIGVFGLVDHLTGKSLSTHLRWIKSGTTDPLYKLGEWAMQRNTDQKYLSNFDNGEPTIQDYWNSILKVDDQFALNCMSVLQDRPIEEVMSWYNGMQQWENNGSRGRMPSARFLREEEGLFGNASLTERGIMFYKVLDKFFIDRGRMVKKEYPFLVQPTDPQGEAQVGFNYIKSRYWEQTFYQPLIRNILASIPNKFGIDINALLEGKIPETNEDLRRLKLENPDAYAVYELARVNYSSEKRMGISGKWEFNNVLMYECDPGILRRSGPQALKPAAYLSMLQTEAEKLANK